jgi:DNA ligase-1
MARENRMLVMLAQEYDASKHRSAGMWMSEKLDGMRGIWIPETRGLKLTEIPFANVDKKQKEFTASGLWSRYGNPIFCPDWFVEGWPPFCLDGELWIRRKSWDSLMSAVKKHEPSTAEWTPVKFYIFERPHYDVLFRSGRINEPQYKKQIDNEAIRLALKIDHPPLVPGYLNTFDFIYRILQRDLKLTDTLRLHEQEQLPFNTPAALERIAQKLEEVTEGGGEGLMLRHPGSEYETVRSKFLLKVKKLQDAEATVIGYRAGQGKYAGMLGSLRVQWEHGVFELSGMDDSQRVLTGSGQRHAAANPGELLPSHSNEYGANHPAEWSEIFPVGTVVTFRYRELTPDKMPKEGRFLRIFFLSL